MNQIIQVPPITFSYQHIASNKGQLSILLRCETFCMLWDILLSGLMLHPFLFTPFLLWNNGLELVFHHQHGIAIMK